MESNITMASKDVYFVGVTVETKRAKAALVSILGKIVNFVENEIRTWNEMQDFYEQSSENIWNACVDCIKEVTEGIDPGSIKGIGFTATNSLAVFDQEGNPLTVSPTGNNERNIILWLDHRAEQDANLINKYNHSIWAYDGGKISPEMAIPKLVWLKKNLREECWDKAGYFFNLQDFLTWRATDCDSRSFCTLVFKWNYVNGCDSEVFPINYWNNSYLEEIGLEDLSENNWKKIGSTVLKPGHPVGEGLSSKVAEELGLVVGTPVGTSMINTYAGALALLGCQVSGVNPEFHTRLCLICGTSINHIAIANDRSIFIPGICGPYDIRMIYNTRMYFYEADQRASEKLLDHVIENHPASRDIKKKLNNIHIQQHLNQLLENLAIKKHIPVALLSENLHVHDNGIIGITNPSSQDEESLALVYLATVQSLSYGSRLIIEKLRQSKYSGLKSIVIGGGLSKNPLFTQTQADVCNLPVVCPNESESKLVGSAILGAAKYFQTMARAIAWMGGYGTTVRPNKYVLEYHNKKYKVYLKMLDDQLSYKNIMK